MLLLLVQFLVLGATGALFWIARRDLASRAAVSPPLNSAGTEELEQLCATLEALVTDLSRRLTALEQKEQVFLAPAEVKTSLLEQAVSEAIAPPVLPADEAMPRGEPVAAGRIPPPDPQYAPVYALIEAGITDAQEVARRTGLSHGEVDLILGLRTRQVL